MQCSCSFGFSVNGLLPSETIDLLGQRAQERMGLNDQGHLSVSAMPLLISLGGDVCVSALPGDAAAHQEHKQLDLQFIFINACDKD